MTPEANVKTFTAALLLVLMVSAASASADRPVAYEDYIPGQLAVALEGWAHPDELRARLRAVQSSDLTSVSHLFEAPEGMDGIARDLGLGRFLLVTVGEHADHLALLDYLGRLPDVESVDLNWRMELQWTPNDPLFPEQWALQNTGQQPGYVPDIDMDVPEAWDVTRGENAIVIAMLDSGINYNHEDLTGRIWSNADEILDGTDTDGNGYVDDIRGWDFVNTSDPECVDPDCLTADNDPMDGFGHGTWVSGVAGAATDNGLGVAGVCPECVLMPCRVFHDDGAAGTCEMLRVIQGAYYAVAEGADVLNMSFASVVNSDSCYVSSALQAVLDYAHASGVVVVASAGNDGEDQHAQPACYPSVVSVAGHDPDSAKSSDSNYGAWVDVAAPSAVCQTTYLVDGEYGPMSGTSIASAQVAGLAGLLLSANPELTPFEVRQIIMDTSIPVDWPDTPIAAGRVNAYSALTAAGLGVDEAARLAARLQGNYPNPFNLATVIEYGLPVPARADLRIYDLSGRLVRDLSPEGPQSAGVHRVPWHGLDDEGRQVASGVYFYRLEVGGQSVERRMVLVK